MCVNIASRPASPRIQAASTNRSRRRARRSSRRGSGERVHATALRRPALHRRSSAAVGVRRSGAGRAPRGWAARSSGRARRARRGAPARGSGRRGRRRTRRAWPSTLASCTPGSSASRASGPAVSTTTVVRVRWRSSSKVPVSAVRPARMIVTWSHSASTSERMWLDSRTVPPAACASRTHVLEDGRHQRVEAGRGLVEQVQLDVGRRTPPPARPSAGCPWSRRGTSWSGRAGSARCRSARRAWSSPPRRRAEQVDHLAAGEVRPQVHLAGHVREAAVQVGGVAPGVHAQDRRRRRRPCAAVPAGSRSVVVLPAPFGPRKPWTSPASHRQIEVVEGRSASRSS